MSAEKEAAVGTAEHIVRNKIKPIMDNVLEGAVLDFDLERWSFISIIMPERFAADYPEVAKYHKKTKVLEFRLPIPFDEFLHSDEKGQISLILNALEKTTEIMSKFKVPDKDRETLRHAVTKARDELMK